VAEETPAAAFELSGRAVELGYDLRLVIRELSRVVRDLLVLSVDPSRIEDPEIAAETERDRLKALAGRFSREDLLRAFDVLSKAEVDIRGAVQPRYHLEMALLRWIHMRKLVPLTELLAGLQGGGIPTRPVVAPAPLPRPVPVPPPPPRTSTSTFVPKAAPAPAAAPSLPAATPPAAASFPAASPVAAPAPASPSAANGDHRDAFLSEIRRTKEAFYKTVVAQAQKIEVAGNRITFAFLPIHRLLREKVDASRTWLEAIGQTVTGQKMVVTAVELEGAPVSPAAFASGSIPKPVDLKAAALGDAAVQAMLDVFPAEIEDVEEI
jgi:DNA polymerase-3 subunit gamma/tau